MDGKVLFLLNAYLYMYGFWFAVHQFGIQTIPEYNVSGSVEELFFDMVLRRNQTWNLDLSSESLTYLV